MHGRDWTNFREGDIQEERLSAKEQVKRFLSVENFIWMEHVGSTYSAHRTMKWEKQSVLSELIEKQALNIMK